MTSKIWLFIDKIVTSPAFIVGYLAGAIVATVKHGYASYGVNVRNAQKGLL